MEIFYLEVLLFYYFIFGLLFLLSYEKIDELYKFSTLTTDCRMIKVHQFLTYYFISKLKIHYKETILLQMITH